MSSTLTQEQYESLKIIEGERSTILTTAIVRLFIFHQKDQKWLYSGLCGALCLTIDRAIRGAILFRLYDLNFYDLLFEQELYYEFENLYQELNECFFCFPVIGNFVLAFSFADSNEALNMKIKINQYCPKKPKPSQDSPSFPLKKGAKTNVFEKNENKIVMEKPTNFKHLNHIGWDPINKCFDFSQLSKEFKTVFKNAGIKKKEMRNAETALAIYETLLNQGNLTQVKLKINVKSKQELNKPKNKRNSIAEKLFPRKSMKKNSNNLDIKTIKEEMVSNEEKNEKKSSETNTIGPSNPPNIPLPPKINLNLLGPPPPIELSKLLNDQNVLGLDDSLSLKKAINKPKNPVVNEGNERNGLIDQIKAGNFKLKKVEPQAKVDNKQLSKQEEMSLTMVLAKAIAERRKNMVRDESESEPESEWSD